MRTENMGVSADQFADAVATAATLLPEEGYRGNNPEAPAFSTEKAIVEVRPYARGKFEVRVLQEGERFDLDTNGGRSVYQTEFLFARKFVK